MASAYETVTERLIHTLETGTAPWRKPWAAGECPQNLISRRAYRGVNVLVLSSLGYASPFWLTFRQAAALGGHVRKGERGAPLTFWRWIDAKEDPDKRLPLLRLYFVFNTEQCEGITVPSLARREFDPIAAAESIIRNLPQGSPTVRAGAAALYDPTRDEIRIPPREAFDSPAEYYCTFFHEAVHGTGHSSRLNREGLVSPSLGSEEYSKEELIAEIGAAFLCSKAGILTSTIENSAAYLRGWIEALRADSRMAVHAAAQAQKAADWILNRKPESEGQEDDA